MKINNKISNAKNAAKHSLSLLVLSFIAFLSSLVMAQEGSDIYIGKLNLLDKEAISDLKRITENGQYTNQPYFFGHNTIFYTQALELPSASDEPASVQMDIFEYNIDTELTRNFSNSSESEYSPTPLPNSKGMSVIRVNEQGKQELWRLNEKGSAVEHLVPAIEPVGYQLWLNQHEMLLFVLGEPHTLQKVDIKQPESPGTVVDTNIGASLYRFKQSDWYLYSKAEDDSVDNAVKNSLKAYNHKSGTTLVVSDLPLTSQYFALSPTGHVISSDGKHIYQRQLMLKDKQLQAVSEWQKVELEHDKCDSGVSRMNVASHSGLIALVCPH
ncbi:hypothetical protein ISG33_12735 [Glaciecola sp. MH2013]|uniref:hypothetical protein n=1 Tax=Glaciecola sp. MH2013 TaxID=2785524 RepID=UPI00189DB427|nr:hypothetical protein [Glaciecola sp. MH2013]MBF7074265.1 hypothetical protein [Glaciecola sp. MH2013]